MEPAEALEHHTAGGRERTRRGRRAAFLGRREHGAGRQHPHGLLGHRVVVVGAALRVNRLLPGAAVGHGGRHGSAEGGREKK